VEDIIPFYPYSECTDGGIYFINIENMIEWIEYNNKCMVYFRYVKVPDDAEVYIESNKFKASKLIFSKKYDLRKYLQESKSIEIMAHRLYEYFDFYCSDQKEEKVIELIKKDVTYFRYTVIKTQKIYLEAIKCGINPGTLNGFTYDFYTKIIDVDYTSFCYIQDPSKELFMYTIDSFNKQYIDIDCKQLKQCVHNSYEFFNNNNVENAKKIINALAKQLIKTCQFSCCVYRFFSMIKESLCKLFVKKNWKCLKYCYQTNELCTIALKQSYEALNIIKNKTDEYCMRALSNSGEAFKLIQYPTREMRIFATIKNGKSINSC
jgi:hypothetical protein